MQDPTCRSQITHFQHSRTVPMYKKIFKPNNYAPPLTHTCSPHNIPHVHLSTSYRVIFFCSLRRQPRWWMPFYFIAFVLFTFSQDSTLTYMWISFFFYSGAEAVKSKYTAIWQNCSIQYMVQFDGYRPRMLYLEREKPLNVAMVHSKLERRVETKCHCEVVRCSERTKTLWREEGNLFRSHLDSLCRFCCSCWKNHLEREM